MINELLSQKVMSTLQQGPQSTSGVLQALTSLGYVGTPGYLMHQLYSNPRVHRGQDRRWRLRPPVTKPRRATQPTFSLAHYGQERCSHVGRCHCGYR